MAFSKALCSRIEAENKLQSTSTGAANGQMTTNQSHSRRLAINSAQTQHIIIDCKLTHHRVLATFLTFTKARFNDIEMHTAAQYSQCAAFAQSYEAPHFRNYLADFVLPKVTKEDPMGTFAFACETDNQRLMKESFPYMGNHWCITVDSKTGISSWNTYANTVYAVDTPTRCADAFASKIGLARFRAFLLACERALDVASACTTSGNKGQLEFKLDADEYYTFNDKQVWKMIYEETMAYAAMSESVTRV